jgi:phospholipase C
MRLSQRRLLALLPLPALIPLACGSSGSSPQEGGVHDTGDADSMREASQKDAGPPAEAGNHEAAPTEAACGTTDGGAPAAPTASNIKHLVVVVQENHSFDNYFAEYCTAATGSQPTCNTGPACCETGPAKDPGTDGDSPVTQDDAENGNYDPDHLQACELSEIDDGKMDDYVTSSMCGNAGNFAYANEASVKTYWDFAASNALADRYFQSIAGASSSNDLYLATASFVFTDDDYEPAAIGASCEFVTEMSFTNETIADLLGTAGVSWGWFGQGYDEMLAAAKTGKCPIDPMCPAGKLALYPCIYDPGDDPFSYFKQFADNPRFIFDYTKLACDLASSSLPAVSYVKPIGYRSEHPGLGDTISAGEAFVTGVVDAVEASPYKSDTLILVTWDESGGFFDHVPPPANSTVDDQPYGPRIPLLAIGPFAKVNHISHVQMEHSSIVKFIEWNWLGQMTGQLAQRDAVVNNIGDLLDPTMTGTTVPSD